MRQAPTLEQLRRAPKVLLHDHLDGGLRPATVIELARETGYETFEHTVGVMQTKDALLRVAQECAATRSPSTRSGCSPASASG